MSSTYNWFDIVVIVVILLSAILAFLRGFIRDLTGLLNWVLAILLTYFLSPFVVKLFEKSKYSDIVINSAVHSIMFVVLLIIISIITSRISTPLSEKLPKSVDQSLGFAFGFAKGYLIICLVFSIIIAIYASGIVYIEDSVKAKAGKKVGPSWLTKSKSYAIFEVGSEFLKPITNFVMDSVEKAGLKESKSRKDKILDKLDEVEISDKLKDLKKHMENEDLSDENITDGKGYDLKEIRKMNHLIEVIDNQE